MQPAHDETKESGLCNRGRFWKQKVELGLSQVQTYLLPEII